MIDHTKVRFTRDSASAVFQDTSGIDVNDGQTSFSWDEIETVTVNDEPVVTGFDTDTFYKLPATVARPIAQPYTIDDTEYTFLKPREELQRGAWSLHNAPFTLGHPPTRMVRDSNEVHGFWRDPVYDEDTDELNAHLYVPVTDEDARGYIEENQDVSVGFYNKTAPVDDYDGEIGAQVDNLDGIDAYQTNIYFDHIASVQHGRCSPEDGCGIQVGADEVPDDYNTETSSYDHAPFVDSVESRGGGTLYETKDGDFISATHITHDYRDEEGKYYAVGPDENSDGVPKYPIDSCTGEDSVESAWHLRNHGHISISVTQLEERIKRRANELDCDSVPWEDGETDSTNTMTTETDCGSLGIDALSVDAVAAKHDGVQDALDEKDERIEELETELDEMEEENEELEEQVSTYEEEEKRGLVNAILEMTEALGTEEELMEMELSELEDAFELVQSVAGSEEGDEEPEEEEEEEEEEEGMNDSIEEGEDVIANADSTSTTTIKTPKRKTPWS